MQIVILSANNKPLCSLSNNNDSVNTFNFYDSSFQMNLKTPNTFEFSCPMNHANSKYIAVGNQVIFKYKDKYHLFKITEMEESHGSTHTANCYCEGASLDLLNSVVLPLTMPSTTLADILPNILSGTEWQVGNLPSNVIAKDFETTSYDTVLQELQNLAELFEVDVQYRIEYNSSYGITGKYIDFQESFGKRTGLRFEYGVNTSDVTKTVNSENVCTAVIPIGTDELNIGDIECTQAQQGFDKPKGQVYVALSDEERSTITDSPYHLFTSLDVESTDPYVLALKAWEHLQDNKTPKIEYTFNPAKLANEIDVGDKVYCIDREMNLQLEATVSEISRCFEDPTKDSVTLTNFVEAVSGIDRNLINTIKNQLKDLEIDSNVIIQDTRPNTDKKPIVWVDTSDKGENNFGDVNVWDGEEWLPTLDKETIGDMIIDSENNLKDWVLNANELKIYFQSIAPVDVADGQLWIDSSTQPYVWKRWDADTNTWEVVMETDETLDAYTKTEIDQIVDEINGVIANKVSRTELNPISERLTIAESQISQTASEVASKVSQTTYDLDLESMKSRMDTAESNIIQNANSITAKVSMDEVMDVVDEATEDLEADLNSLTNRMTEAELKITDDAIINKVTNSEKYQADFEALNAKIEGTDLDLLVGSRNLLLRTNFEKYGTDCWTLYNTAGGILTFEGGWGVLTATTDGVGVTLGLCHRITFFNNHKFKADTDYVLQFEAYATDETPLNYIYILNNTVGNFNLSSTSVELPTINTAPTRYCLKFKTNASVIERVGFGVLIGISAVANNVVGRKIYIKNIKLEEATTPTDWTEAPEDLAEEFSVLEDRVQEAELKITPEAIVSTVTSSEKFAEVTDDVLALDTRVSSAEEKITADAIINTVTSSTTYQGLSEQVTTNTSQIEQTASAISSKVSKGSIISEINQSAESVQIKASKIALEGNVTASDIQIGNSLTLGALSSSSTKAIKFNNDNAWIYAIGGNMYLDTATSVYFYTPYIDFNNATIANFEMPEHTHDTCPAVSGNTFYGPAVLRANDCQAFYFSGSGVTLASNNYSTFICGSYIEANKTINIKSDIRKKENIVNVNDDEFADFVLGIDLVEYNYIDDETKEKFVGAIAQQVEAIDPEVSKYYVDESPTDGTLSIKESALVYPIISTLKRQQKQIEEQQMKLNEQEERIANLEAMVEALMNK